jgi:cyclase
MPIGIGGAISSLQDINNLLKIGADKVIIKTKALTQPDFINQAANVFGNQCITIAVDAKKQNNEYKIFNKLNIDISLDNFIKQCEDLGAGEFIVNSVDNDGMMNGFDIELIKRVERLTYLPIVACGGGGKPEHYTQLFQQTSIEAVASASVFHFTQYTPDDIKRTLESIGKPVRITI